MALIAALGAAAELAQRDHERRSGACLLIREQALAALHALGPRLIGDKCQVMTMSSVSPFRA